MDKLKNQRYFKSKNSKNFHKLIHIMFILLSLYLFYTYIDLIILLYCYFFDTEEYHI